MSAADNITMRAQQMGELALMTDYALSEVFKPTATCDNGELESGVMIGPPCVRLLVAPIVFLRGGIKQVNN